MVALYFCRTPLQSLIVSKLLTEVQDRRIVIYHATSDSKKHYYYFDRLNAEEKIFLEYLPRDSSRSDTLAELASYYKIPGSIRRESFSAIYLASIGSIICSILIGANKHAKIHTFEDGAFNLNRETFFPWIEDEPWVRKLVKFLYGGPINTTLVDQVDTHFTIYPISEVVNPSKNIEKIELTLFKKSTHDSKFRAKKIRVLLGTWFSTVRQNEIYDALRATDLFDIFLPHPAESNTGKIKADLFKNDDRLSALDLNKVIAEDLIVQLVSEGYLPVLYGIDSTALLNLSRITTAINIHFENIIPRVSPDIFRRFGVKEIEFGCSGFSKYTGPEFKG